MSRKTTSSDGGGGGCGCVVPLALGGFFGALALGMELQDAGLWGFYGVVAGVAVPLALALVFLSMAGALLVVRKVRHWRRDRALRRWRQVMDEP